MKKIFFFLLIALMLGSLSPVKARPLGLANEVFSLYGAEREHQVGDIIAVKVSDTTSSALTQDNKQNSSFIFTYPSGSGLFSFFEGFSNGGTEKVEDSAEGTISRSLKADFTARVIEKLPRGLLKIQGSKAMIVDKQKETLVLTGVVREKDIAADNSVQSCQIAELDLSFQEENHFSSKGRKLQLGIINTILRLLF